MSRSSKSNSHSAKARSRSSSRAPGGSRSHRKPYLESEGSPAAKYASRAREKARKMREAIAVRGEPEINLRLIAQKAMEKYGFETSFSLVIEAKANALDEGTVERAIAGVKDMRHLPWSSIGDADGMCVEQAEYCERGQGGSIVVKVAIADVDAYVPKGSLLDGQAQASATTVYTKAETFPMLPERLSCDLSSLQMENDRLAIVAEFAVLPRGNVRAGKVYRAVVRNKARLGYDEVGAWLEGGEKPEMADEIPGLEEQLKLQEEASARMNKFRSQCAPEQAQESGTAANEGKTLGLCVIEKGRARGIIENFMIGANAAMESALEGANAPVIRRVIKTPKSWEGIVALARARGFELPPAPDAAALSEFLKKEKADGPEKFSDMSLAVAKLLGSGEYCVFDRTSQPEYFCLAVANYFHRASPNGKYIDLIAQRLLKAALAHTAPRYGMDELVELAKWCTDRGHAARQVEKSVKYVKA